MDQLKSQSYPPPTTSQSDAILNDLLAALEFLMSCRPKVARALHVEAVQHRVGLIQQRARREVGRC